MLAIVALTALALLAARLAGAPAGSWRPILAVAAAATLGALLLPSGHPLRLDPAASVATLGWLAGLLVPLALYALWLRALRRRAAPGAATAHPTGLVQIADDVALVAETVAALADDTTAALGPLRPLSLAWRADDGTLAGHLRLRQTGATAEIEALRVAEAHRGQGIGSRLLAAAETEARARGLARLAVAPGGWQAPGFFARAGYVTVAERDLGRGARRLWMERTLS